MIYNKSQRRGIPRHKNKESKWNWGGHALSNSNNETKKLNYGKQNLHYVETNLKSVFGPKNEITDASNKR